MIDVNQYLDDRNRGLWEELNNSFNINIDFTLDSCYGNYLQSDDCTIYVPVNKKPDAASFTHELLHLYLPQRKIYIGGAIECMMCEIYPLNTIFDKCLYDHIKNSLEHVKMLPIFLRMGYPIESFLLDYYEEKLTANDVKTLRREYKSGFFSRGYKHRAVNYYIGKFFAAKADINPTNHYDKLLSDMNQLDSSLYSAIDKFWNGWIDYDVEKKRDILEEDYNALVDRLVNELNDWSNNKKIV